MTHTRFLISLALFCGAARADFVPDVKGAGKPDFVMTSLSFAGKSMTSHAFKISSTAAPPATLKLGAAKMVGLQGDACEYQMTFEAMNAGPGAHDVEASFENPSDGPPSVALTVDVKFPDGSSDSQTGTLYCLAYQASPLGYTLPAGSGCSASESVTLAVGTTKLKWTFDPNKGIDEFSEANNVYDVSLIVGPRCEPLRLAMQRPGKIKTPPAGSIGTAPTVNVSPAQAGNSDSSSAEQSDPATAQPRASAEAIAASRQSLIRALQLGTAKPIKRPGAARP